MHPHTPTTIPGRAALSTPISPRSENALSSGFWRTEQVFSRITSASWSDPGASPIATR